MDKEAFEQAKVKVLLGRYEQHGFGTLQEKSVHSVMKLYYEPNPDFHEVPIEGYIADIYTGSRIIEIQNGNFNRLRDKLETFLPLYKVMVVFPIPHSRWLVWMDKQSGELSPRRKSPITGSIYSAFPELYKIKKYLTHPNLSFAFPLIDMDEYRVRDARDRAWRKRGTRYDRMPLELHDEIRIERKEDFIQVIPIELENAFTVKEFAKAAHIHHELAQITLHILYSMKLIDRIGKRGREYLYEVSEVSGQ
ncbi:MAG: hypothetical protein K2H31_09475 [Lachnospiraceae bacterium]|nr:hypothetical protein [Lachnospiraceae bacterium]